MQVRTWGPFTGRQLTTMFCVTVVMVLLPVAAWGAAASHVVVDSGKITVASPVAANVAQRSQFISSGTQKLVPANGTDILLIAPPTGRGLVITSVHLNWVSNNAGAYIHVFTGSPACSLEANVLEWDLGTVAGDIDAAITPGYVVPPGKVLCAHIGGTATLYVNAFGYIVAAGDARSPQLAPAASPNAARP
jgi:hypothetical protein